MKFARYLKETQTPEWKKAYIDYRGLKKKITAIRHSQEGLLTESLSGSRTHLSKGSAPSVSDHHESLNESRDELHDVPEPNATPDEIRVQRRGASVSRMSIAKERRPRRPSVTQGPTNSSFLSKTSKAPTLRGKVGSPSVKTPSSKKALSRKFSFRSPNFHKRIPPQPFAGPVPLNTLLPLLSPQEAAFFTSLDTEFEKIESFYLNREKEMSARTRALEAQMDELFEHRKRFYAAKAKKQAKKYTPRLSLAKLGLASALPKKLGHLFEKTEAPSEQRERYVEKADGTDSEKSDEATEIIHLDPDDYQQAKKALKKAVVEHYRGLETLNNYRILNITGIRKALKKFEKITKIPAQEAYMTEKVDTSAFATDRTVSAMMKEMEEIYTQRFVHGNKKKAMVRLRTAQYKTHHFSTFRSGMMLGLAIPAFITGLYHSFQAETRRKIDGWDGLLFVYGVCFVPLLFSMLISFNLLVWARKRINYVFIFELDLRTRLDHREYFEIPAFLFLTFSYAFWLSFARIGASTVSPVIWPLVWLAVTAATLFEPLPLQFKPSRYWLAQRTSKLFLSGLQRVEFTDFWLGDQFCSLIFTLSNTFLIACAYARGFDADWRKCGTGSKYWPVAFCLAILPLLARFFQSLKRYADSRLVTHLINAGKYASGVVAYFFYFLWRHQGGRHNAVFALWCIFNTIYSLYATAWDSLMDWSLMKAHAKHPFLRDEIVYSDYQPIYYLALVSNILIRFIWVIYIPSSGPDFYLRNFIVGLFEAFRRWQWNFFRLENEHLGNVDQYRITREVPLPYAFDVAQEDDKDDDDFEVSE